MGCTATVASNCALVRPAFTAIAERHAGRDDALAYLVDKVRNGAQGSWGQIPMPANAAVSEADTETLVKWILGMADR